MSIALRFGAIAFVLLFSQIARPENAGLADEARLKQVIRDSILPKPVERKPLPEDVERLLAWSKPVGGLAARIEAGGGNWRGGIAFVRLKNLSDAPMSVPSGNPKEGPLLFETYVQQGAGAWQRVAGNTDYFYVPGDSHRKATFPEFHGARADRPWVKLGPGEDCLAVVAVPGFEDVGTAIKLKVVLRQPRASGTGEWTGVVETPPYPAERSYGQAEALRGALPFPNHFPALSYDWSPFVNAMMPPSGAEQFWGPNRPLLGILTLYDPADVRRELEKRIEIEKTAGLKFLLAGTAAAAGSEKAALFLLEAMKNTDYETVCNVHYALELAYSPRPSATPDWVIELSLAALSDNRPATGLERVNQGRGASMKVCECPDNLISRLGESRSRRAVPLLIDWVRKKEAGWDTIMALGEIGDARAIPPLIELLEVKSKKIRYTKGEHLHSDADTSTFEATGYALSKLKAREAVPILLKYVEYPEVIEYLERIGDPSVQPTLREIVNARGRIVRDGQPVNAWLEGERVYQAKVALAHLDGPREIALLGEMLADPVTTRDQRYWIVRRLVDRYDPQAIPFLVKVVKTDPDHYIIHMAISGLSHLKYKAAVEGLIECFDVNFKSEDVGKGEEATPATYRNLLACALQRITGQAFGADKQQWLQWWREKGQESSKLK
jgi:hypothetical protein